MIQRGRFALLALWAICGSPVLGQSQGETLFTQTCVACHTIGGGRLVGPDLANIHLRRDEAWVIRFIQSSGALIAEGDTAAVALYEAYNEMPMPDHPLSDNQVRSIMEYIAIQSPPGNEPVSDEPVAPVVTTADDIERGREFFVGQRRFANGGAACSSCHNVRTDDVMTGGSLALDLTTSVSRLTRPGIDAMMLNPPFPAMRAAFVDKPLSEDEVRAVGAFLQSVDENHATQEDRDFGRLLAQFGLIGLVFVLGFFSLLGIRSTKRTVNHHIYDRQIRTRPDPERQ